MIDETKTEKIKRIFGKDTLKIFKPLIYKDLELLSWKKGDVRVKLPVTEDMLNLYGRLHGGMTYTLCDISTGLTALSVGSRITTLQGTLNYIKPASVGYVTTKNKIIHDGKSTVVCNVEVINEKEELIASGVFTMFVIETIDWVKDNEYEI